MKPGAKPKFCKSHSVPSAVKAAIEKELDRLESEGILEKVSKISYSEWAAPVSPVPKARHQKAMWLLYKVTINLQLEVDHYPLPKPDDMIATLAEEK